MQSQVVPLALVPLRGVLANCDIIAHSLHIDNIMLSANRWRWLSCEVCPQIAVSSPPHRSSLPAGGCSGLVGAGGIGNVKLEILKVKS